MLLNCTRADHSIFSNTTHLLLARTPDMIRYRPMHKTSPMTTPKATSHTVTVGSGGGVSSLTRPSNSSELSSSKKTLLMRFLDNLQTNLNGQRGGKVIYWSCRRTHNALGCIWGESEIWFWDLILGRTPQIWGILQKYALTKLPNTCLNFANPSPSKWSHRFFLWNTAASSLLRSQVLRQNSRVPILVPAESTLKKTSLSIGWVKQLYLTADEQTDTRARVYIETIPPMSTAFPSSMGTLSKHRTWKCVSNSSPGGPLCLLVFWLFSAPLVHSSHWLAKEWTHLGLQALIDSWLKGNHKNLQTLGPLGIQFDTPALLQPQPPHTLSHNSKCPSPPPTPTYRICA